MSGKKAKMYVDHRERNADILRHMADDDQLHVKMKQLPVGDYIVSERTAVERKKGSDFVSSIINGRIFKQAEELKESFDSPIIIIEGDFNGQRNVHPNALRGAISSLMIDYQIPVLQTKDAIETAQFVSFLAKREQLKERRVMRLRGEKRAFDPDQWKQFIVESLPGIGPKTAKALLNHFGTVENVFIASKQELREVEGIGDKRAKEIRQMLSKKYEG